jgi:hypothetical protein
MMIVEIVSHFVQTNLILVEKPGVSVIVNIPVVSVIRNTA